MKLKTSLAWSLIGQAVYMLSQLGVLVILAQLTSAVDVGRFGLATAIATPIVAFSNMGMRLGLATDVKVEHCFGSYLAVLTITTSLAVLVINAVGAVSGVQVETAWIILVVSGMKAAEAFSELFYGAFQKQSRMDLVARSQIMRGLFSLGLFAAILWQTGSPFFAFISQCVVFALVATYSMTFPLPRA